MSLSEKIKQILDQKNISPSLFADEIGIQRSSVSHILAGRNKPSLDIVQKIVKRFPELGVNWILDDEALPDSFSDIQHSKPVDKRSENIPKRTGTSSRELDKKSQPESIPVQKNVEGRISANSENKQVERVLIFYSDGTFQEFKQAAF